MRIKEIAMQLRPILSTLRRHKLTASLLVLQVAFTCAIVCNVVFMVVQRIERVSVPSGIAEAELSVIHSSGFAGDDNPQARQATDLAALRAIRGVRSAVAVSYALPLSHSDSSYGVCPDAASMKRAMQQRSSAGAGCLQPSMYDGTAGLIETFGLQLTAGRDFTPDDYVVGNAHKPPVAIITRALAQRLYPGQNPLGKSIYLDDAVIRVVGVVDRLLRPSMRTPAVDGDSMIWPQKPDRAFVTYVLRSAPEDRARILHEGRAALLAASPNRLINPERMEPYTEMRARFFQRDTTMIGLLIAAGLGLLFVTALGIAGLANFWVQQRTRSIGIRRAIGATRGDILRYFQAENSLIVGGGIVLGTLLAFGFNLALMTQYELPRLPWVYLPIGALALWLLGQLAVLGPALRAAAVPPVVATRSV
jgi:putative ABC transport system permease protein